MAREAYGACVAKLYRRGKTWWYQFQGERFSTKCTDKEAAQAVFASVVFASRFHEGIAPLAVMAAERLHGDAQPRGTGKSTELCQ